MTDLGLTDTDPLDDLLADWAKAPVACGLPDLAAITALPQQPAAPAPARRWPLLAGGAAAMAAAIAAVFMVPQLAGGPTPANNVVAAAPVATTHTLAEAEDKAAFASVFTPTDIEEDVI